MKYLIHISPALSEYHERPYGYYAHGKSYAVIYPHIWEMEREGEFGNGY